MNRLQIGGMLWVTAGMLFAIAWFVGQPRSPINLAVGVAFAVVGFLTLRRARGTRR